MSRLLKKRFDLSVMEKDKTVSKTFELDKTVSNIRAVLLTADKDDLMYFRGTVKIEINKEEIFPENYECKLLMSGINVAPNQRWYDTGSRPSGNGEVRVDYRDQEDGRSSFVPYRISIYLLLEIND
jgi:hypothetical protein